MCAILNIVSALLDRRPIEEHFRRIQPLCESGYWIATRIPEMCAILHIVSVLLDRRPIEEHFRRIQPLCEPGY